MLKNTLSITVSWGHCDPAKIVFYPNYFMWFDQNSHNLFDKAGLNMGSLKEKFGVIGLPIVDVHAEFISPSKYNDEIEVISWLSKWGKKSLIIDHEIYNKGVLAVKGTEVRVWAKKHPIDPNKIESKVIPDYIKKYFEN